MIVLGSLLLVGGGITVAWTVMGSLATEDHLLAMVPASTGIIMIALGTAALMWR